MAPLTVKGDTENIDNTQGIVFTQVGNSLILKVKDIAIFAVKFYIFFRHRNCVCLSSQFCV